MSKLAKKGKKALKSVYKSAAKGSKKIANALTGGAFKKPDMPDAPEPIPLPDEEDLVKARRRRGLRSGGRASTILTNDDSFGAG